MLPGACCSVPIAATCHSCCSVPSTATPSSPLLPWTGPLQGYFVGRATLWVTESRFFARSALYFIYTVRVRSRHSRAQRALRAQPGLRGLLEAAARSAVRCLVLCAGMPCTLSRP